jgi:hypothetical protein
MSNNQRKPPVRKAERQILLRLNNDEYANIKKLAELHGVTMTTLLKNSVANKKMVVKTDILMLNELRRVAGLAKKIFNESGGTHASETSKILLEVAQTIKKIGAPNDR